MGGYYSRPPKGCVAQAGSLGQVRHGKVGEGSEEASGCLGHKPQNKMWRRMGLNIVSEKKTKGIYEDRPNVLLSSSRFGILKSSNWTPGKIFS